MRFVLRGVITTLSFIPPAIAGEAGANPNTFLAELPGVIAQAPTRNVPSVAPPQSRQATQAKHGPWLFPPIGKYLDQNAGG